MTASLPMIRAIVGASLAAFGVLLALTWLAKLDILLFGRVRSGPFFALLTRTT